MADMRKAAHCRDIGTGGRHRQLHWNTSPIDSGRSGATSLRFHQPPPSAWNKATVSA
jgi:hypothetical protein